MKTDQNQLIRRITKFIETGRKKGGVKRECGACSLCCKVMGVPEVKQPHEWCQHARPGCGGCAIYRSRPERCREFHCVWLIDKGIPDYWYPLKSKIVIDSKSDGTRAAIAFVVDPAYPERWREEPWFSDIKHIARAGIEGRLGQKWLTVVRIKDVQLPIVMGVDASGAIVQEPSFFNGQP